MAEVTLLTPDGADTGTVELDDTMFDIEPNVPVMHQVVTAQLARRRAGTQSTKNRGDVRGGGAKPHRQKGTGRARQGSIRAPQYTGGGVAHAPKPRSYAQRTPKKMVRLALRSALSDRARDGKVVVVDSWTFDAPKTKDAVAALRALGVDGHVLVVIGRDETIAARSFRNLPDVHVLLDTELNAYDVLCSDYIVFTQATLPSATDNNRRPSRDATPPAADQTAPVEETASADDAVADEPAADEAVADEAIGSDESDEDES